MKLSKLSPKRDPVVARTLMVCPRSASEPWTVGKVEKKEEK
jgi:hypothetical protein